MRSTQYLYEIDLTPLTTMLYPEALQFRIDSANKLLSKLLAEPYQTRDYHRIREVHKAISFNQTLLEEIS